MSLPIVPEAADLGTSVDVHAGFPNAAVDTPATTLSLDHLLIPSPHSTYLFRVRGHHWEGIGIFDGDIAIVDKAIVPRYGDAIVSWNSSGELIMKHWQQSEDHLEVWGVITATVHRTRHS